MAPRPRPCRGSEGIQVNVESCDSFNLPLGSLAMKPLFIWALASSLWPATRPVTQCRPSMGRR